MGEVDIQSSQHFPDIRKGQMSLTIRAAVWKQPWSRLLTTVVKSVKVNHDHEKRRFTAEVDTSDNLATLTYELRASDSFIHLTATTVPKEMEGKGVGSVLAKNAFDYCIENKFKVKISCWFLDKYLEKHPDLKDKLTGNQG